MMHQGHEFCFSDLITSTKKGPKKKTWVCFQRAQSPQDKPQGCGAMWIRWELETGALAVRSQVADAGNQEMEYQFSGGDGSGACEIGEGALNQGLLGVSDWEEPTG